MQAYHIVDWQRKFELTDKGRPAAEDTPMDQLRKTPIPYLRYSDNGLLLSPAWLKLMKNAWSLGVMMDIACYGLYWKLVDIARAKPRKYRGWILCDKNLPLNAWQVADILGLHDSDHIKPMFDLLCLPAINKLELLPIPADFPRSPNSAQLREKPGEEVKGTFPLSPHDGGNVEEPFKDVTETEVEVKEKFKRKGSPGPAVEQFSPPPPSDKDSALVSEIPVTASGSVPQGGEGRKKEIATAKQQFLFELHSLIRWRNQSDRTTLCDIADQLEHKKLFETELALFCEALKKARGCAQIGKNPLAMFVAAMKKSPFNYIPKGTSYIRGAKDRYV